MNNTAGMLGFCVSVAEQQAPLVVKPNEPALAAYVSMQSRVSLCKATTQACDASCASCSNQIKKGGCSCGSDFRRYHSEY